MRALSSLLCRDFISLAEIITTHPVLYPLVTFHVIQKYFTVTNNTNIFRDYTAFNHMRCQFSGYAPTACFSSIVFYPICIMLQQIPSLTPHFSVFTFTIPGIHNGVCPLQSQR